MAKWTVRLPDEVAGSYRAFCTSAGISIQGALEASVRQTVDWFEQNNCQRPHEWTSVDNPDVLAAWQGFVDRARELDAEKRSRE